MKAISLTLLVSLILFSCARVEKKKSPVVPDSVAANFDYSMLYALESYLAPENVNESEVQNIDSTCAIVVYPNEDQLSQLEEASGGDFETIVNDGNFYQSMAMGMLDSLGIRTVKATGRYIRIGGGQMLTLDMRKKHLPAWNLILYNVHKQPIIVSSTTVTLEDIAYYFEIPN